jgi:hypothetical protein
MKEKKQKQELLKEGLEKVLKQSLYLSNGKSKDIGDKVAQAVLTCNHPEVLEAKIDVPLNGDIKLLWNILVARMIIFLRNPLREKSLEKLQEVIRLASKTYSNSLRFKIAQCILAYYLEKEEKMKKLMECIEAMEGIGEEELRLKSILRSLINFKIINL